MNKKLLRNFHELIARFDFLEKYKMVSVKHIEDIYRVPFMRRSELEKIKIDKHTEDPIVFYESTGGEGGNNFFIGINKKSHDYMVKRTIQALGLMRVKRGGNCLNLLFSDLVERGITDYGGILMSIGDVHNFKSFKLAHDALQKLNIKYVFACPNLLHDILLPLGKNHSIEKCMVSGELLLPWFRKYFYKNTGIPLYNWYGSTGGFIAAQDNPRDEYMRILDEGLYLEIVDKSGNHLETGRGFLVLTDLFNYSTPIIRYWLEDEVELVRRNKNRYIKIYKRKGKHIKLDGELVCKSFIINRMKNILHHKDFFVLITKSQNYEDRLIIFLLKIDLKKEKKIKDFFHRNIGLIPIIKILDKATINHWITKKENIIDMREVK